jgi:tungstate transport system substrate-binding protein
MSLASLRAACPGARRSEWRWRAPWCCDRATYLALLKEGLKLEIMVEGDKALFNPYGVIAVNPAKNSAIQAKLTDQFINWLISLPVQEKIAQFGMDEFNQSLFTPDSTAWRTAHPDD